MIILISQRELFEALGQENQKNINLVFLIYVIKKQIRTTFMFMQRKIATRNLDEKWK